MARKFKIKKGDKVVAIAGKDKGKSGEVLRVLPKEERVLVQADLESRKGAIAILQNDGINLLFARKAAEEYDVPNCYVGMQGGHAAVTGEMVHEAGSMVLFGDEVDIELWDVRVRRGLARIQVLRFEGGEKKDKGYIRWKVPSEPPPDLDLTPRK